ncbi:unnamed protein product [Rotaria magnacalcarata]|uniref:Uncharacterized protein n=2 Tax=Rotaria magnacalcarata TaxID=392030 RepID=A0A816SIR2_9BILA|nr:unnamed protein product [Rotaria magnacalcarata]CAF1384373.1 unnamed protein product [Rotaria magnacalcarata]CAF2088938.1 unnamed protein product [Rotaria magnacalcarata]CAF4617690.1 unnamed protein product [Rotaria magnacalcarata]
MDREAKLPRHVPKLLQIQFAQFLNNLLEYSSELTYFAINAFQTSSLRRVQINTLQRFSRFCVPRACAYHYNLDTEFDNFVRKMRLLCALTKRTFVDMRLARIHIPDGKMTNLPVVRRSIDIFKCNINRLRDLKQIHQDIGYDLLLPDDQLYLALDLLVTDFELLNCELENQIKFSNAMVLQTIVKDIFLQYRIALTWIYPAVKYAAYRPDDPNSQQEIKKCDPAFGIQHINDYCGKPKKLSRTPHIQSLERIAIPTQNMNPNCTSETISDCSIKSQKKRRKCSRKSLNTTAAIDDFNRYLNERKLHKTGIIHLKKYELNKKIYESPEFNQIVSIYRYYPNS